MGWVLGAVIFMEMAAGERENRKFLRGLAAAAARIEVNVESAAGPILKILHFTFSLGPAIPDLRIAQQHCPNGFSPFAM